MLKADPHRRATHTIRAARDRAIAAYQQLEQRFDQGSLEERAAILAARRAIHIGVLHTIEEDRRERAEADRQFWAVILAPALGQPHPAEPPSVEPEAVSRAESEGMPSLPYVMPQVLVHQEFSTLLPRQEPDSPPPPRP